MTDRAHPLADLTSSPLLVTGDADLAEQLRGIAVVAGVALRHVPDLTDVDWSSPSLLLLGLDVEVGVVRAARRRPALVLISDHPPGPSEWAQAVELGVEQVAVLPEARDWLLTRLVDAAAGPGRAPVVGVVGSRGGAGATALASALAVTAARRGLEVILVDVDAGGSGLDLVFGSENEPGLRWHDLRAVRGRMQPGQLRGDLPRAEGVRLLSWDRRECELKSEAVQAVVASACTESDLVIVDLPRCFDEAGWTALAACHQVIVVVPAEVRAAAAAQAVVAHVASRVAEIRLVVRGPAPSGLDGESIAGVLQLPLFAELRPEPGIAATLDRGVAPPVGVRGPLAGLCRRLLRDLFDAAA